MGGLPVMRVDDRLEPHDVVRDARVLVVTNPTLAEKIRICTTARSINPRIAIVATAESGAEHAWLREFGVEFVCDTIGEMNEALLRAVRRIL